MLFLLACSDPTIVEAEAPPSVPPAASVAPAGVAPDPAAVAGSPGLPPGPPGPPADGAGAPDPNNNAPPAPPAVPVHPGTPIEATGSGVSVSGTTSYAGSQKGTIRVDFLRQGAQGTGPELVGSLTLKEFGPFSVEVPPSLGKVVIVAYIDANGDGPSEGEARGHAPLDRYEIGTSSITGVDITLSDELPGK